MQLPHLTETSTSDLLELDSQAIPVYWEFDTTGLLCGGIKEKREPQRSLQGSGAVQRGLCFSTVRGVYLKRNNTELSSGPLLLSFPPPPSTRLLLRLLSTRDVPGTGHSLLHHPSKITALEFSQTPMAPKIHEGGSWDSLNFQGKYSNAQCFLKLSKLVVQGSLQFQY